MRVAVVCFGTTGRGGMETVLTRVINGLNFRKIETRLFLLGGSADDSWLQECFSYTTIGSATDSKLSRYMKYLFVFPILLVKFRPDILIGADERAVFVSFLLKRVCRLKARLGSWIHFSLATIDHRKLRFADFHIAISEGSRQQLGTLDLAGPRGVYLVHNPIDVRGSSIPRPSTGTRFIYVGRLMYNGEKRTSDLLRALSKLSGEWDLSVIGDGDDAPRLKELAISLGISSRVKWLGWVHDPWNEIKEASALVLTSESEGFGMVLVEAMSNGIPCISSDCPTGPAEIVSDGENGWLYPPQDLGQLTTRLQNIVNDPTVLPTATTVRASIAKFSTDSVLSELSEVFVSELQGRPSRR